MKSRQGHRDTNIFLTEWHDIASKTGFADNALIAFLKAALHTNLLTLLSSLAISNAAIASDLTSFLAQIRRIDSILRQTNPNYFKAATAPVPITPTNFINPHGFLPPHLPLTTTHGGEAMDISASRLGVTSWTADDLTHRPRKTPAKPTALRAT